MKKGRKVLRLNCEGLNQAQIAELASKLRWMFGDVQVTDSVITARKCVSLNHYAEALHVLDRFGIERPS